MYSKQEITLENLTWNLSPSLMVDDIVADVIGIYLSPEIPVRTFRLSDEFKNINFKGDTKKEWAKKLREIADKLEEQ